MGIDNFGYFGLSEYKRTGQYPNVNVEDTDNEPYYIKVKEKMTMKEFDKKARMTLLTKKNLPADLRGISFGTAKREYEYYLITAANYKCDYTLKLQTVFTVSEQQYSKNDKAASGVRIDRRPRNHEEEAADSLMAYKIVNELAGGKLEYYENKAFYKDVEPNEIHAIACVERGVSLMISRRCQEVALDHELRKLGAVGTMIGSKSTIDCSIQDYYIVEIAKYSLPVKINGTAFELYAYAYNGEVMGHDKIQFNYYTNPELENLPKKEKSLKTTSILISVLLGIVGIVAGVIIDIVIAIAGAIGAIIFYAILSGINKGAVKSQAVNAIENSWEGTIKSYQNMLAECGLEPLNSEDMALINKTKEKDINDIKKAY